MQKIILVYGAIAGVIVVALFQLTFAVGIEGGTLGMVVGFLSMFIAMSMVFVGVRKYRDEHLGGAIRFWKALGVGLGIAGVASLFYVVGWEIYMWATDYTFMDQYMAQAADNMRASGASAAEIARFQADSASMVEMYKNPIMRMGFTLMEISPVALLVPFVSAGLLSRPGFMPARV
jgi:hypothetical protein